MVCQMVTYSMEQVNSPLRQACDSFVVDGILTFSVYNVGTFSGVGCLC